MKLINSLNEIYNEVGVVTLPERKKYIHDTLLKMNINVTIVQDAILGKNLNREELINSGLLHKDSTLRINEVACALSHFSLIQKFYTESSSNSMMIFEDDIIHCEDYFQKISELNIPEDYDIVQYGHCWNNCFNMTKISEGVYKSSNPLCCHSYAVSKSGAKKILERAFPIKEPIDVFYVKQKEDFNIYTIYPRVFNQGKSNNTIKSTLGNDDNCAECTEQYVYSQIAEHSIKVLYICCIVVLLFLFYLLHMKK